MRTSTPLSLLLPVIVSASPVVSPSALNALFCKANVAVISALNKDVAATTYCSSYLHIPTSTISTTVTNTPSSVYSTIPVTITGEPVTKTETLTETTSTDVTITTTEIQTTQSTTTLTTSTSTITCLNNAYTYTAPVSVVPTAAAADAQKRGVEVSKPAAIPTDWSSVYVSSACSCLAIPTPSTTTTLTTTLVPGTVTVYTTHVSTPSVTAFETTTETATNTIIATETTTTTQTITAYAVETTIASNGVQYRKFEHDFDADDATSDFTSSYFNGKTPDFSGVLTSLSFSTPNWPSGSTYLQLADRSTSFASDYSAILLQGFFIAKESGVYQFISSGDYVDNWAYLWSGDVAYSSWSDSNTSMQSSRVGSGPYVTGSYTVALDAGDAIPITYLWANGGGVAQSKLQIITPSGSSYYDHSGFFVQACSSSVFP